MKTKRLLYYIFIALLLSFKVNGQELITVDNSMVLIPAGSFLMGKDSDKSRDFSPAHKVNVHSFYMDKGTLMGEFGARVSRVICR